MAIDARECRNGDDIANSRASRRHFRSFIMIIRMLAVALIVHIAVMHYRLAVIERDLERMLCQTDTECEQAFEEEE